MIQINYLTINSLLDLSNLNDLSGKDLIEIGKLRLNEPNTVINDHLNINSLTN